MIHSDTTRHREKNLAECFRKFYDMVKECAYIAEETSAEKAEKWKKMYVLYGNMPSPF